MFQWQGHSYGLEIRPSIAAEYADLSGGTLAVYSVFPHDRARAGKIAHKWLKTALQDLVQSRFDAMALQFNCPKPMLRTRAMRSRWGSYHPRHIVTINTELAKYPVEYLDYVILHELCHIFHRNHQKGFYDLLASYCPNYRKFQRELRKTRPTGFKALHFR